MLIVFSLILGYSVTVGVAPRLFIANTPQINTQYIASLINKPQEFIAYLQQSVNFTQSNELAQLNQNKVDNLPVGLQFIPMAKGVEAAEDSATGQRYVKVEAGTKLQVRTIKLSSGKVVTIYVPVQ